MLLVRKHMLFAAILRPRYWLMENVPRLERVLGKECSGSRAEGWEIPYEKLGIPEREVRGLGLEGDCFRVPVGVLLTATDFGACQNRQRFIAGDFPIDLLEQQKCDPSTDVSLGGLLERFERAVRESERTGWVADPNYPWHRVRRDELRDHFYDTSLHPLYWEELRHLKRRHIQYGRMDFPDDLRSPARTVMATCTSSSREAIVLDTGRTVLYHGRERPLYRQPTVREVACIQGFPISFQLAADRIGDRYKLVGNAVPCQMAFALARAITEDIRRNLHRIRDEGFLRRAEVTLRRQEAAGGRPIIRPPRMILGEAVDLGPVHMRFRARPSKRLRRKLLSSKLEDDSCVVIFENEELEDGRLRGGECWKSCIQRGVGDTYHKVYLDEVCVTRILRSMGSLLDAETVKEAVRGLLAEVGRGIPLVGDGWTEFPGWNGAAQAADVTDRRLRIPSVSLFQRAFTSDMPDLGNFVSPIDFFDGLDAIMLSVFGQRRFRPLVGLRVFMPLLKDRGGYPQRDLDRRIVPELREVEVPLVTLSAALLSVHVLHLMYSALEGDPTDDRLLAWRETLSTADREIRRWAGLS
jgi:site-specific DNA-cytosine methylase